MGLVETRLAIIPGGGGLIYKTAGFHVNINVSEMMFHKRSEVILHFFLTSPVHSQS